MQFLDLGLYSDLYDYEDLDLYVGVGNSLDAEAFAYTSTVNDAFFGGILAAEAFTYTSTIADASLISGYQLIADPAGYTFSAGELLFGRPSTGLGQVLSYGFSYYNPSPAADYLEPDHEIAQSGIFVADAIAYTLTVDDAVMNVTRDPFLAEQFNYVFTVTADLRAEYLLIAEGASYTSVIADAEFISGYRLEAEADSYALTVNDAELLRSEILVSETTSYALTFNDATLVYNDALLNAEQVQYSVTFNADLARSVILTADTVGFALTGGAAELTKQNRLIAETAAYTSTLADANLITNSPFAGDTITYTLTVGDVDFTYTQDLDIGFVPNLASASAQKGLSRSTAVRNIIN